MTLKSASIQGYSLMFIIEKILRQSSFISNLKSKLTMESDLAKHYNEINQKVLKIGVLSLIVFHLKIMM